MKPPSGSKAMQNSGIKTTGIGLDLVVHPYVIPATQEAEIRRIEIPAQPRQKVTEIPSQPNSWV
jgi:hypothetical protein